MGFCNRCGKETNRLIKTSKDGLQCDACYRLDHPEYGKLPPPILCHTCGKNVGGDLGGTITVNHGPFGLGRQTLYYCTTCWPKAQSRFNLGCLILALIALFFIFGSYFHLWR